MKALITGIDFSNFGSLAMLAVITRYFDGETVLITHVDPKIIGANVEENNVEVIRMRDYARMFFVPAFLDRWLLTSSQRVYRDHFRTADVLLDISGFAMSSQFPLATSVRFFAPLILGAKHDLSMTLMPQSFGPFNYRFKPVVMPLIKMIIRKVQVVYARDQSSLRYMMAEGIKTTLCDDTVFLYDRSDVPVGVPLEDNKRYVGVVTNLHLLKLCSRQDLIKAYREALIFLINKGFVPVIFSHTLKADSGLLADIVEALNTTEAITPDDYLYIDSPLCLPNIFYLYSRFEFIVASRFHSIVLNFASGKPAVIIGWADKYKELSEEFSQQSYVAEVNAQSIIAAFDRLIERRDVEAQKISDVLNRKRLRCAGILKRHLTLLEL